MGTAAVPRRFCRCACFCSENLYVARYGLHVRFRSEQQLREDYEPVSGFYWLCGETRESGGGGGTSVPGVVYFAFGALRSDENDLTSAASRIFHLKWRSWCRFSEIVVRDQ